MDTPHLKLTNHCLKLMTSVVQTCGQHQKFLQFIERQIKFDIFFNNVFFPKKSPTIHHKPKKNTCESLNPLALCHQKKQCLMTMSINQVSLQLLEMNEINIYLLCLPVSQNSVLQTIHLLPFAQGSLFQNSFVMHVSHVPCIHGYGVLFHNKSNQGSTD